MPDDEQDASVHAAVRCSNGITLSVFCHFNSTNERSGKPVQITGSQRSGRGPGVRLGCVCC